MRHHSPSLVATQHEIAGKCDRDLRPHLPLAACLLLLARAWLSPPPRRHALAPMAGQSGKRRQARHGFDGSPATMTTHQEEQATTHYSSISLSAA